MVITLLGLALLFIFALIPGGGGIGTVRRPGSDGATRQVSSTMATVDGHKIIRRDFERQFGQMTERNTMGIQQQTFSKYQLLESIIDRYLLLNAAKAEGIRVSDQELDNHIEQIVDASVDRSFADDKQLRKYLKEKAMSYEQYRSQIREAVVADQDALRDELILQKLQDQMKNQAEVTEEKVKQEYEEIKARHILIRPQQTATDQSEAKETGDEATESSPPQDNSPKLSPQQAQQQARQQAEKLLANIKQGADFTQLAKKHSDDPGNAEQGGELGWFGRRGMVQQFSEAAFSLEPGQVSEVVESPFGFHIIKVEDKRTNLPDDFEENKQRYIDQAKTTMQRQAWEDYRSRVRQQAIVDFQDPEMKAMGLLNQGQQGEALTLLAQAAENDPYNMTARYTLSELFKQNNKPQQAINYLRQIAENQKGASSPQVHLSLGKLLRKQDKQEEALNEFESASDWAAAFQFGNYRTHIELKMIYEEMKHSEGIQQEQKWLDEFQKDQQKGNGSLATLPPAVPSPTP